VGLPVVGPGLALHLLHFLNEDVSHLGILKDQVAEEFLTEIKQLLIIFNKE
jgi:hypothetical protein